MFFTLLTFFFFAKPYFTVKRETLRVSLLLFLIFIPAMGYKHYSSLWHSRIPSLQLRAALFDATHRLADVVIACSVAHAEALRVTECVTANSCYVSYLKQVHSEVVGILYHALAIGLAEVALALREHIERSVWNIDLQSRYLFHERDDEVTTTLKRLTHILHALL